MLEQSMISIPIVYGSNTLIPSCVYLIVAQREEFILVFLSFIRKWIILLIRVIFLQIFAIFYINGLVPLTIINGLVHKYPFNTEDLLLDLGSDNHYHIIRCGCIFELNMEDQVPKISTLFHHLATTP